MLPLESVSKVYKGDVVALHEASVEIDKGEFVFLVGASGSGKSTFLRLINREETPERGKIYVAGKEIASLTSWKVPYLRRNIGSVLQDRSDEHPSELESLMRISYAVFCFKTKTNTV